MHLHCHYKHFSAEYNKEDKAYNGGTNATEIQKKAVIFQVKQFTQNPETKRQSIIMFTNTFPLIFMF